MGELSEVMVRTGVLPDGSYAVTIEIGDDTTWAVDVDHGLAYAATVVAAAARAEYDAAVMRQLGQLEVPAEAAAMLVGDLRNVRPELRWPGPLELLPGVAQRDGSAFLTLHLRGTPIGQWSADDARSHAINVLDALSVAPLDGDYHAALAGVIGLEDAKARAVVGDLENHR